jgi:hypothetical protein
MGGGGHLVLKGRIAAALIGLSCLVSAWLATTNVVLALPPGRHYEMVSEPYKAGYGVGVIEAATPVSDGWANGVAYTSIGSFAGAPSNSIGKGSGGAYIAMREPSEWVTHPAMLPASLAPYIAPAIADYSSTFEQELFYGQRGANAGVGQFESAEAEFLMHPVTATDFLSNFTVAGQVIDIKPSNTLNYSGASPDFSHVVFEVPVRGMPLTEEAEGTTMEHSQYDLMAHGAGEQTLRLIGVDNAEKPQSIAPNCNVFLGSVLESGTNQTAFHAVSSSGEEIFFHTCAGPSSASQQLFVRLNGERTLEVSRPLNPCVGEENKIPAEVPCEGATTRPSASFVGASEDGSRVFFTTTAHLVGEYEGSTADLYMATIGCSKVEPECDAAHREITGLQRIGSAATPGESTDVQGVVSVSPDGSHIYFVAGGVLGGTGPDGAAPLVGADNLYVYDASSQSIAFIGDLCSRDLRSGEVSDAQCPANLDSPHGIRQFVNDDELWANSDPEAQVTHNGAFMIFSSYAQLTGDDNDNARDVYRYDASSEALERVSIAEAGYESNGNGQDAAGGDNADASFPSFPAVTEGRIVAEAELGTRAIAEDGERIVFSTAEPLSAAAANGLLNAYEWNKGAVSLVSSGTDAQPVGQSERLMITPSGEDIFFITVQKLLKQDTDEVLDVYDARTGPDLPPPPEPVEQYCEEEACQGPLSIPAPALAPLGTAVQTAGENRSTQDKGKVSSKKKAHKHKHKAHKRKHKHKQGRHRKRSRHAAKSTREGRR